MIKSSRGASRFIVDTTRVKLERLVGGVNGNRHGCDGYALEKGGLRTRRNIVVVADVGTNIRGVESALVRSSGSVWVGGFGVNTVVVIM